MENIKFDANGLICAIAQDSETGEVLMQAYMNAEALEKTLSTGYAHYYSRSRQKLWKKGEESGHVQKVIAASFDCDRDCLLLQVRQTGAACHTGNRSCFFTPVTESDLGGLPFVAELARVVEDRKNNPVEELGNSHKQYYRIGVLEESCFARYLMQKAPIYQVQDKKKEELRYYSRLLLKKPGSVSAHFFALVPLMIPAIAEPNSARSVRNVMK